MEIFCILTVMTKKSKMIAILCISIAAFLSGGFYVYKKGEPERRDKRMCADIHAYCIGCVNVYYNGEKMEGVEMATFAPDRIGNHILDTASDAHHAYFKGKIVK